MSARLPKDIVCHRRRQPPCFSKAKAFNSFYAKTKQLASEIIFKKAFTFKNLCDIISLARARFSDFGANLNEVFTRRILGAEANNKMR